MSNNEPLYNWLNERSAGVMLHISSLPSDTGIGNLGAGAYEFVDFLRDTGFSIWQICPLGPTGYGDSPYQCFSAFAGNPYFIDFKALLDGGLLTRDEYGSLATLPHDHVDYGRIYRRLWPLLRIAYERFKALNSDSFCDYGSFLEFKQSQSFWLESYAQFVAFKEYFGGKSWLEWPEEFRSAPGAQSRNIPKAVEETAEANAFYQYLFYAQFKKLRAYTSSKCIQILGDTPIFVSMDSVDIWSNPELFQLRKDGKPDLLAGVPPDYFSKYGQLWGNPLYNWAAHKATGFKWWIRRIQSNLEFCDIVRLDHFRGFESCWAIPAGEKTAVNGKWIPSPGLELFQAIREACPHAKLIAEDLGVVTEELETLLNATGLPGMAVLQFAFGGPLDNAHLPHNHDRNLVVYPGTHDNDTTTGWYQSINESVKHHIRHYLRVSGKKIARDFIRTVIQSSAYLAIIQLQDLLELGSDARLNSPGTAVGNWKWRYSSKQLELLQHQRGTCLRDQLTLHGRR